MLDAPFFIDDTQLNAFYDAVLQPQVSREESIHIEITEETARNLGANLDIDVNPWRSLGAWPTYSVRSTSRRAGGSGSVETVARPRRRRSICNRSRRRNGS
jgi:hypothetical protein